jgi:hypothetical protein
MYNGMEVTGRTELCVINIGFYVGVVLICHPEALISKPIYSAMKRPNNIFELVQLNVSRFCVQLVR